MARDGHSPLPPSSPRTVVMVAAGVDALHDTDMVTPDCPARKVTLAEGAGPRMTSSAR